MLVILMRCSVVVLRGALDILMSMEHKNMPTMIDSSPSTHQLNMNQTDYLCLLLGIIESQNWGAMICAISSNPIKFQWFMWKISRLSELNGMTM